MTDTPPTDTSREAERAYAATETALSRLAPAATTQPVRLHDAMRHSLLSPGKRVRPILAILCARQFGSSCDIAVTSACAIEMIHAASLILDDLPAMDDATLRRGRPTSHAMFGDDTAMLAAIGLMNLAYDVVARDCALDPEQAVRIIRVLSRSVGSDGLVAGQEEDLHGLPTDQDAVSALATMHRRKTGALFAAAAEVGGIVGQQPVTVCDALHEFGMRLGLAFQTLDDLLDAVGSAERAGKDVGTDGDKPTLVTLTGLEQARAAAKNQIDEALAIVPGGEDSLIGHYARMLVRSLQDRLTG